MRIRGFLKEYGITLGLIALTLPMIALSGLDPLFLVQEFLARLGWSAILVLALLPMLHTGMGFNFALGAGVIAGQIGLILAVAFNLVGLLGLGFAVLAGLPFAVLVGWITGQVMNRGKGYEMLVGFFLMRALFGWSYVRGMLHLPSAWFPEAPAGTFLDRGYGLNHTIRFENLMQALDKLLLVRLGPFSLPLGTYLAIVAVALPLLWILKTKLGQDTTTIGSGPQAAEATGISVNKTRMKAVVLSMVLACVGQVVFLQSMGNLSTYFAHDQATFFVVPALIAGGAILGNARIRHAIIGILVLHTFLLALVHFMTVLGFTEAGPHAMVFVSYALVAFGLIRHGMEKSREAERARMAQETP